MAWLTKLDARANHWPTVARWAYLAVKWYLIVGGFIIVTGLAVREWREGRVGIGTGFFSAVILGLVKGVLMARSAGGGSLSRRADS